MSLKKNILANYASQIYVTLIGIFMVPLYVRHMGAEAYGLVGFFAMLQAWFQLLDIGLTPTMSRETARFNGGATDADSLRRLLRALEGIFVGIALLGGGAMALFAGEIADHWLKVQHLPLAEVRASIQLMAVVVALRWVCGLYRGAITGFERIVWLSGFNVIVSTCRFVLVLPYLINIGNGPTDFFLYQAVLAVVELVVLIVVSYRLLPARSGSPVAWSWQPLRGVLKFSLTLAFTSSVWVMVTQTDKLILSKILPLSEYAFYTLAVLVASGVMIISGPISIALMPRLTKLVSESKDEAVIDLYRAATQMVALIALPAALVLALFGEQVLAAWSGDHDIASKAAPVLMLYALGNGLLVLGAFPYYLQYARGDLKLHLWGNVVFIALLIPSLVAATIKFGTIGAGWAWLGANAVYFFTWVPLVHRRFAPGMHWKWFTHDIGVIAIAALACLLPARLLLVWPNGRIETICLIAVVSLIALAASAAASSVVRSALRTRLKLVSEIQR